MIYFIRDNETKFIKIGFTAGDVDDRLRKLQTGCPGQLTVLVQMPGSKQDESALHERFAEASERGEWFKPVPELRLVISEAKVAQLEESNARLSESLDAARACMTKAAGTLGMLSFHADGEDVLVCHGEENLPDDVRKGRHALNSLESLCGVIGRIADELRKKCVP